MKEKASAYLRRRRTILGKRLVSLQTSILRGSLIEQYKPCGKPGCKCSKGKGHGPKYYLSISFPKQRPEMDYVPLVYHPQVTEYLGNFQKVKKILEEICMINRELLRRREKL